MESGDHLDNERQNRMTTGLITGLIVLAVQALIMLGWLWAANQIVKDE